LALESQISADIRLRVPASCGSRGLFTAHKDRVFPHETSVADLLWSWHIGRAVEAALKSYAQRFGDDPQTAAILKRGARFFSTAVTAHMLRLRNGDDFISKVGIERLADRALQERLRKYANIGVAWYVSITRTMIESGAELPVLLRNVDTSKTIGRRTGVPSSVRRANCAKAMTA